MFDKFFLSVFTYLILSVYSFADVINKIEIDGNKRISLETIKVLGVIELNKDYSKYYDTIFNYNYSSILNEVYYENDGIIDTDNQIYIDYHDLKEFTEDLDNLFYLLEIYLTDTALNSQAIINDYNEEIIKLSKRENNIIIIAFILQLIIFCIIQYFEINSIRQTRKKNA